MSECPFVFSVHRYEITKLSRWFDQWTKSYTEDLRVYNLDSKNSVYFENLYICVE